MDETSLNVKLVFRSVHLFNVMYIITVVSVESSLCYPLPRPGEGRSSLCRNRDV